MSRLRCAPLRMAAMSLVIDVLYLVAALVGAPVWLVKRRRAGKVRIDWSSRLGRIASLPAPTRPRLLFHAVSVGEANAIRGLVERLAPAFEIVIACTTDTGLTRAQALFAPRHAVVRYPLDLSRCVRRFLDAVRPDAAALVELEVWPNFTRECERRGIALAIVNGRLSERSFPRYRRFRPFIRPSFRRINVIAAQDETIAGRFVELGARRECVHVVGTMKWDNALDGLAETRAKADELAALLGIDRARPVVVAGSTGPGEEALVLASIPAGAQLIVAPRRPERFDEVSRILSPCRRRSEVQERSAGDAAGARERHAPAPAARFLLDSIGELRVAYALADVVIIGRTFNRQRGSDMMEAVALGKAVIVGPDVSNFESVARALIAGGAIVQVTPGQLPAAIARLLNDPAEREGLGRRGLDVIRAHRGAVEAHARLIEQLPALRKRA